MAKKKMKDLANRTTIQSERADGRYVSIAWPVHHRLK